MKNWLVSVRLDSTSTNPQMLRIISLNISCQFRMHFHSKKTWRVNKITHDLIETHFLCQNLSQVFCYLECITLAAEGCFHSKGIICKWNLPHYCKMALKMTSLYQQYFCLSSFIICQGSYAKKEVKCKFRLPLLKFKLRFLLWYYFRIF